MLYYHVLFFQSRWLCFTLIAKTAVKDIIVIVFADECIAVKTLKGFPTFLIRNIRNITLLKDPYVSSMVSQIPQRSNGKFFKMTMVCFE